jgi:hypothetical protein
MTVSVHPQGRAQYQRGRRALFRLEYPAVADFSAVARGG